VGGSREGLRFHYSKIKRFAAFDMTRIAASLAEPLLLVHDWDDIDVPWQDATAIACARPGARMLMTGSLGRRCLLRDPHVIAAVADFMAALPRREASPPFRNALRFSCGDRAPAPRLIQTFP
jgi:hypothetical protein